VVEIRVGPLTGSDPADHLTAGEIASLLDHSLTVADRGSIEAHLDACAGCRAEVLAVARLAESYGSSAGLTAPRSPGRSVRRRWLFGLGGAIAAGLAALLWFRSGFPNPGSAHQPVRAPDFGEGRARLGIVAPSPDSLSPRAGLRLLWRGSSATLYRVIVLTQSGEPLWTADTPDTAIVLPDSVTLLPGHIYFWQVEGIGNGITASTGAHRLRVRP